MVLCFPSSLFYFPYIIRITLFKTNDVFSYNSLKFLKLIFKFAIFLFVEKNVNRVCSAEASLFFQQQFSVYLFIKCVTIYTLR